MASTFTPSEVFREESEKEWPSKLGGLDWDFTRIVFTKRTLVEFLRYTGTSVDPNLNNIAKLPRYADFGHLESHGDAAVPGVSKAVAADTSTDGTGGTTESFKPSRRVRTVPGGPQTFTLGDESDDAFATKTSKSMDSLSISDGQAANSPEDEASTEPPPKSSRRVRTGPGGPSTMSNLWDDDPAPDAFKPTRRVRERPGGVDSISQIF